MRRYKNIFIIVGIIVTGVALGAVAHRVFFKDYQIQIPSETVGKTAGGTASETVKTSPCVPGRAPDGSIAQVCPPTLIRRDLPLGVVQEIHPLGGVGLSLVTAGTGTTTLKKTTPFNDILIAESGSPYAGMRNARYTMWPYPGEIAFKEVYLVLPDSYEPLFSGYSNKQFVEIGGEKNIMLYVRRGASTGIGADARVLISSPTVTNEKDHPLELFDSTDSWEGFSLVSNGEEVVVEIILTPALGASSEVQNTVRVELAHAVEGMEIIW